MSFFKKRAAIEEIMKIIIAVVVLVLMISVVVILFKGKGGDILNSIKNLLRFGRR